MPNKLEKLKQLLELMQNDTITPKQVKEFLDYVLQTITNAKKDIQELSQEYLDLIQKAVVLVENNKVNTLQEIVSEKQNFKSEIDLTFNEVKQFLSEVKKLKTTKGEDGKDGYTPIKGKDYFDGENGKDGENGSPDTPEEIREKLETLEGENRLDASAIKNLPEFIKDDKRIGFGSMLREAPKDNKTYGRRNRDWVEVTGGGGGSSTYYENIGLNIQNGIKLITIGYKGLLFSPGAGTIQNYKIQSYEKDTGSDIVGSIQVTVKKNGTSIGTIILSTEAYRSQTDLSSWTSTSILRGDKIEFVVDSVTGVKNVHLSINTLIT